MFCWGVLIVSGWRVMQWGRKSYLRSAEIEFFCLLLRLILEGEEERWVQDFHLLSQGFESFPLDHRDWVGLIQCVCSICRWLRQKWLVYVLLEFDAAVGEGCGIWEHLHSFREVKWERGVSPRFYLLVLCMV